MNYLEIVLQGCFNENNRVFLEKYFFREYKKAEKEQFFEADEFFTGCLKVIEGWEKHLQDRVFKRKTELYFMLSGAKDGTVPYGGDLEGKTIEQKNQERIEFFEQELKDVRPDGIGSLSFTVHLHSLTNGRVAYNMPYSEVLQIKNSILKSYEKTQSNNEPEFSEKHQKPTPSLEEFISENLNKALNLNLSDYPLINEILQRQKDKLRDAQFESEFSEVKDFAEKGIKEIKNRLQLHLRNNPDNPFINALALYLLDIRLFHEYNKIYNEISQLQPISTTESRTKKVISETFKNMDKQGWQYAFISEQDYDLFTGLLTNFFEYEPYTLPKTTILLKRTCKTKVAKALGEIHKELSNENKLTTDTKYFELIRILSHFEKETEGDLYKALTR